MAGKIRTEVRLKVKPLAPKLVQAQIAGEISFAFTGSDIDVRIAQEGFARGLWRRLVIYGLDRNGRAQDMVAYGVDHSADDMISIEDDENRSMIERTDKGLAEAVIRTKARYDRKGLTPEVRFHFTEEIEADPARKARLQVELGTHSSTAPDTADGYDLVRVATIRPGKDKAQSLDLFWGKRRR